MKRTRNRDVQILCYTGAGSDGQGKVEDGNPKQFGNPGRNEKFKCLYLEICIDIEGPHLERSQPRTNDNLAQKETTEMV